MGGGGCYSSSNLAILSCIRDVFSNAGKTPDFQGRALTVATPTRFPVLILLNRETGQLDGSDIHIVRHLARKFNATLRYVFSTILIVAFLSVPERKLFELCLASQFLSCYISLRTRFIKNENQLHRNSQSHNFLLKPTIFPEA